MSKFSPTDGALLDSLVPRFTWGAANLYQANAKRDDYIQALRLADIHDDRELIKFANT